MVAKLEATPTHGFEARGVAEPLSQAVGMAPVTGIKFNRIASVTSSDDTRVAGLAVIIRVNLLQVFDFRAGKLIRNISLNAAEATSDETISFEYFVLDACFSDDGTKFAVISDSKILRVFDTSGWAVIFERTLVKRATAVAFSHSGVDVCVADKFGDAYRFDLKSTSLETEPIVGHVSVLTDLVRFWVAGNIKIKALSPDDKFIITADRDEKVRVSCYPNGYNIHTFCLGHREFVSSLCLPFGCEPLLISGGGTLDLLAPLQLEPSSSPITVSAIVSSPSGTSSCWVAVLIESFAKVLIFKANPTSLEFHQALDLETFSFCAEFSSQESLYVACESKLHHFVFDEAKARFELDASDDPLVKLVAGTQLSAPSNLKLPLQSELRKLRPGAPGSERLFIEVDEEYDDMPVEPIEPSKKAKAD
ncbi:WD repeat-containing protein 4 [Massospora cicadina]|nr:WD repeat-containing protein 4 [Massospora cicadina]